jgi:hypothetical protein
MAVASLILFEMGRSLAKANTSDLLCPIGATAGEEAGAVMAASECGVRMTI